MKKRHVRRFSEDQLEAREILTEETLLNRRYGSYATRTFADYHIPANLNIGEIDVYFLLEEDKIINRLGAKGIGELGITSVAVCVANAITLPESGSEIYRSRRINYYS